MKSVVTGGMGFIGRHVASELVKRGHDVLVYDIEPDKSVDVPIKATRVRADIRDLPRLVRALAGVDLVFHVSGVLGTSELFDDPATAIDINIKGALNVLLAAKEAGVKRIFFPTKPNEWNNIYSVTAQAVEKLGHSYREHMDLDVRMLRIWNAYGPHQKLFPARKAVPLFVAQALQNKPVEIFGDGTQPVELLYVDDVARTIVDYLLFDGTVTETHEIRAPQSITIRELAQTVIRMTDSKSQVLQRPMRRGEGSSGQFARARDVGHLLCESTLTPPNAGLRSTIGWYRKLPADTLAQAWSYYEHK